MASLPRSAQRSSPAQHQQKHLPHYRKRQRLASRRSAQEDCHLSRRHYIPHKSTGSPFPFLQCCLEAESVDCLSSREAQFDRRVSELCSADKTNLRFTYNSTYPLLSFCEWDFRADGVVAWFSANAFIATVTPVKNGGIPHIAELKLVFKEGGAFEFYNTYTALLDRLQAQGDGDPIEHLEDLPVYSTDTTGRSDEPVSPVPVMENEDRPETSEVPPADDLPPAYDDVASDDGRRGRSRRRY